MIDLTRGDDAVRDVTVTDAGSPVDLSVAQSIRFTAKYAYEDEDDVAPIQKGIGEGIAVDEQSTNVVHITFAAADTRDLRAPIVLVADLEIIDAEGLTKTVWEGYLRILPDVTLTPPGS